MTTPTPPVHPPTETGTTGPASEVEAKAKDSGSDQGPHQRLRWLAFNASAAAVGHLAMWSVTGDPMAGVHLVARLSASVPQLGRAVLTGVAAWAGWKGAHLVRLHRLPGGPAACAAAALGAALWGQGTAPLLDDVMAVTQPWSGLLAPLLVVGPLAGTCWWALDRRAADLRPPVRWLARIPLATLALSSALYTTPGVLL